jgi:hypothetical protein
MKCIACGREMLNRGTHLECSNMLCDYEEAIAPKLQQMECANGAYKLGPACKCALSNITDSSLVLFI